eukprot:COSAG02_NODE_18970_length_907_cov_1.287129_2_plen_74_part_00
MYIGFVARPNISRLQRFLFLLRLILSAASCASTLAANCDVNTSQAPRTAFLECLVVARESLCCAALRRPTVNE